MAESVNTFASFLHVRDPSILAWNRPKINPSVKIDLRSKFSTDSTSSLEGKVEHLQVYLRLKPSEDLQNLYEITSDNMLVSRVPTGLRHVQDSKKVKRKYSFSKIYGPESTQTEIFNDCIKAKVLNFINGHSCTIFTYGTSGSGKTYTILGTAQNPGIIPRSLEYVFRSLPKTENIPKVKPTCSNDVDVLDTMRSKTEFNLRTNFLKNSISVIDKDLHIKTYRAMQERLSIEPAGIFDEKSDVSIHIWVSFVEIYNEYIYDLLQPEPGRGKQRTKLRLGQDSKSNSYVKNLTSISVSSGLEAYEILQYGMHNLNYAATSVNDHSSRSHCIFTIKLIQSSPGGATQISHFNFCDLAGSERLKNTRNVGDRLKESNNINTSLHVLGRCISTIRESQKNRIDSRVIPYRDSKLTMLFQSALSGHESVAMIVNMNATKEMFDESQRVLHFSAIAKDITMDVDYRTKVMKKRFSQYVHSKNSSRPNISDSTENELLREQVNSLTWELEAQKQMFHVKETEIRKEVVEELRKRHQKSEKRWATRYDEQEERLHNFYQAKKENLQQYYETINSKRARITIDDSDEEDEKRQQLQSIAKKYENIEKECKQKDDQIKSLQFSLQTNASLLADAEIEYKELEAQLEEKTCEVFELQREVYELTNELSVLRDENNRAAILQSNQSDA